MNAMEETHLTIETRINGEHVGTQEIHDPFLHNRTHCELSLWDRLKLLWTGYILFEVHIRGDDEAHRQWFRTDPLPGSNDVSQETSAPNATTGEEPDSADWPRY